MQPKFPLPAKTKGGHEDFTYLNKIKLYSGPEFFDGCRIFCQSLTLAPRAILLPIAVSKIVDNFVV